jgi:hypothetical protein
MARCCSAKLPALAVALLTAVTLVVWVPLPKADAGAQYAGSGYEYDVFAHCEFGLSSAGIGYTTCDTPLTPPLSPSDATAHGVPAWGFGAVVCAFVYPFPVAVGESPPADAASQSVWICPDPGAGS